MELFKKGKIGKLLLKNRVIMSPMNVGGNNESDGCLSSRGINYFVERAKGGTGMIVTGAVRVTREFERDSKTIPLWMLFADHMIHGKWISELSERCHDYGTKVCIQLTAGGGRIAGAYAQLNGLAVSPSENPCFYPPHKLTRSLTKEEIQKYIMAFGRAAKLIKEAGADAIQLHGHQGYLLDQFTTSLWNKRTDEYGGSLENRLRFVKEILDEIKKNAGDGFPVIYRYGLTHFLEGGRSIEEGVEMARFLESYGFDALDIDSGCYENNYYPHPPTTFQCGSFAHLAEKVKEVVKIPVITSTRIGYPEFAESIIKDRKADFVSIGRPLIADPDWCNKALNNMSNDIRPCLGCHEGCLRRLMAYKRLSCAVNPMAGDEEYLKITPAVSKKKIAVIGGGIAGMVAAITCSRRGHHVTLYEKDNELGGNFKLKHVPDFKDDYRRYIEYLKRNVEECGIEIRYNQNVDISSTDKITSADRIIIAVGASFRKISVRGLDEPQTISPFELYEDKSFANERIVIVGGGLVGVEAAINVARHGGNPIIIEKTDTIARTAYSVNRQHLDLMLRELSIPIYTEAEVIEVVGKQIKFRQLNKMFNIQFDRISLCVGMESNQTGLENLENSIVIGDADSPENVMKAVWTAYRQCRLI